MKLQDYVDDENTPSEERLHKVSQLRAHSDSEQMVDTIHTRYRDVIENLSLALYDLIDRSILNSAFLTYELVRFVARNAFLDCSIDLASTSDFDLSKLESQLTELQQIVKLDLSKSSKLCLIQNCLSKIESVGDSMQRAIELDRFDSVLCNILESKQDFRAARLAEDFANAVNSNRKIKIRRSMIETVCENL